MGLQPSLRFLIYCTGWLFLVSCAGTGSRPSYQRELGSYSSSKSAPTKHTPATKTPKKQKPPTQSPKATPQVQQASIPQGPKISAGTIYYGQISYYGSKFHGKKTASGERFNQNALTCAHKTLPFGTQIRVTLNSTGESVVVRVNDRGPYAHGRILDISLAAAKKIGLDAAGVGEATLVVLEN